MGYEILSVRGSMMKLVASLLLGAGMMLVGSATVSAALINICGTLEALTRNAPPETPGSATIDGRTFLLTSALSSNQTNRVDADVKVGQRVCLTGDLTNAPSPKGTVDLVQNFVLASCAGPAAPSGCASTLPSTATLSDPAVSPSAVSAEAPSSPSTSGHVEAQPARSLPWFNEAALAIAAFAFAGAAAFLRRKLVRRA